MIEEQFFQYGVLGVWTFTNLMLIKYLLTKLDKKDEEEKEREKHLLNVIEQNTKTIAVFSERLSSHKCMS